MSITKKYIFIKLVIAGFTRLITKPIYMSMISLNNNCIHYELKIDKRRRTILLTLKNRCVIITSPIKLSKKQTVQVLQDKAAWLVKASLAAPIIPHLTTGSKLPYLGSYKTLRLNTVADKPTITVTNDFLIVTDPVTLDDATIYSIVKRWYMDAARKILTVKTQFWGEKIGFFPNRITIKEQKTRWGSCSSLKNINYNWRIVMAPENIIDYLIIHELCHLQHMNHSPDFWQLVKTYSPACDNCRQWLKTNGVTLTLG